MFQNRGRLFGSPTPNSQPTTSTLIPLPTITDPSSAPYHPASRRSIAGVFRRTADHAVEFCIRTGIHPDAISYFSMVCAAGAGAGFWLSHRFPLLLLVAPLLCYGRLWCNMLDGMVALASGKASRRGEILNDLPDRISDILIFAGVAHSGWCIPLLAYWAMISAIMTAYVGTLGQAVAGRREFGGIMSKPWRMVWLNAGAWGTLALLYTGGRTTNVPGLSLLDWTNVAIIVGCVQTIIVRLAATMRLLTKQK